jgi:hypothetical protein
MMPITSVRFPSSSERLPRFQVNTGRMLAF